MAQQYAFGSFVLDDRERQLRREGQLVHLQPKSFDVLRYLLEHAGRLVEKHEILDAVWKEAVVTENSLTACIRQIRIALDDHADSPGYIETIPTLGYRFIAEVKLLEDEKAIADNHQQAPSLHRGRPSSATRKMGMGMLIAALVLLIVYFSYGEFFTNPVQDEPPEKASTSVEDAVSSTQWEKSIAVLPFVNMSEDPGNEYFSDGLSEEILILLAKIPRLKVIGRTSSFMFKGRNEDLRTIGRTLGVENVIEGSVRKSGNRLRISAQLINVSDGSRIWSESYDRKITDIFAVQDDVAAAIIEALEMHVGTVPTRALPTKSLEAYTLFLKAKAAVNILQNRKSEALLLEAINLDPDFAEAYELLAYTYWYMAGDEIDGITAQQLVSEATAKALTIEPDLVLAKALSKAAIFGPGIRLRKLESFEQAVREQPNNPLVLEPYVFMLMEHGYLKEALIYAKRYVEIDPLSLIANAYWSAVLYAQETKSETVTALEFVSQIDVPFGSLIWWNIEGINLVEGQDEITIKHIVDFLRQNNYPDPTWVRELITAGRDPISGQAYLHRRIPEIIAEMPDDKVQGWQDGLNNLYLYFGYMDRHFELIFETNLSDSRWGGGIHTWHGHIFRRLDFTTHPKYLELVRLLGIIDTWEQRGPPDFCEKVGDEWVCE